MMNLTHWRLVVAVVDAGNITHAAERVGMTQSGASQAIAQLEDGLGAPLFARERRRTVPTALGLKVVNEARAMLEALQRIQALSQAEAGAARQTLRLASFPMVLATVLPPVLRRFRQLHPAIDVVPLEASDDEVEALLADGTVDVGVVLNAAPDRQVCPLGEDEWMAVLPSAHPLARAGGSVALADLAAQPFILATGGCSVNAQSLAADAGVALADVRASVRDWSSAYALVREGLGVTLVPGLALPDNRRGLRVASLALPLHRAFGFAASAAAIDSAPVRALFAMLREGGAHPL